MFTKLTMLNTLIDNVVLFVLVKVSTRIETVIILAIRIPKIGPTAHKGVHRHNRFRLFR